ncbi:sensor histidine kinase [Wenyingzhuangia sp. IMCC45533]
MRKLYNLIINQGVKSTYSTTQNKRIALVNTYALIWMHFTLLFPLADFLSREIDAVVIISTVAQALTFLSMILVVVLNRYSFNQSAIFLWIFTAFLNFFSFSIYILPGTYMEYYYIIIPGIALSLYKKNIIPWFTLIVAFVLYLAPYYIIVVYPQDYIDRVEVPAMLGVFLSLFFLVNYFKKTNLANEYKLELAYDKLEETKKSELAHLQLKSLKAQMNPHFMFNAMNSIQSLVLKGDKHEAYQYLSKFSDMIRENLNMSEKSFVSFDEECSLLKKYLELEKLRFKENFIYHIVGDDYIEDIKIPSMIIQPFVENAIKHGLLHKKEGIKKLHINFTKSDVLECEITDNGVGCEQSLEINRKNESVHTSFSTKAIKDRLEILKEYYKTDIGFSYLPAKTGTIVKVKIPYLKTED